MGIEEVLIIVRGGYLKRESQRLKGTSWKGDYYK